MGYRHMIAIVKRIRAAYIKPLGEIAKKASVMMILTFVAIVAVGFVEPLSLYVNSHIFNNGLMVAQGQITLKKYIPYLVVFAVLTLLPPIITQVFFYGYMVKLRWGYLFLPPWRYSAKCFQN